MVVVKEICPCNERTDCNYEKFRNHIDNKKNGRVKEAL